MECPLVDKHPISVHILNVGTIGSRHMQKVQESPLFMCCGHLCLLSCNCLHVVIYAFKSSILFCSSFSEQNYVHTCVSSTM